MSRFVLSSPSNSALLLSLRIAPCELLLRPTPFPATLVHARKGLPTFDRRLCAGCSSRKGEASLGGKAVKCNYAIDKTAAPMFPCVKSILEQHI